MAEVAGGGLISVLNANAPHDRESRLCCGGSILDFVSLIRIRDWTTHLARQTEEEQGRVERSGGDAKAASSRVCVFAGNTYSG